MNPRLNRLVSLLLLTLGMDCLFVLLRDSFSLIVPDEARIWLLGFCVLLWFSTSVRFGFLVGIPLSILSIWYLYRNYTADLFAEFQDILDHIVSTYYSHYGNSAVSSYAGYADSHMVGLLILVFLIAAFVSIALTAGSFRIGLSELATIPFFLFCIAVNGNPPVAATLGMFLFWAGLQIGGESYRPGDAGGKATLLGMIPCAALLALLLLLFRPSHYVAEEQDFDLSQKFDRLGQYLSEKLDGNDFLEKLPGSGGSSSGHEAVGKVSGWDLGQDSLDLSVPYDCSVLNREIFLLNTSSSGSVYLRGKSYGDYTGTGWAAAAENQHTSALSYAAQVAVRSPGHIQQHFQIQGERSYELLYLPYYTISDIVGDVLVPSDGLSSYGGSYYTFRDSFSELPSSITAEELQYRQYVHNYYTRLPDSTRSVMENICRQNGLSGDRGDILSAVADYVRNGSSYDLGVGPYPDSDYAVYFLTVSRRGYCTHFATAACVLYRSLGIPARVCEGFLVTADPGHFVSVLGADAHAWAEVYVDGLGWIPVEVTAGTGESSAALQSDVITQTIQPVLETPPSSGPPSTDTDGSALLPGQSDGSFSMVDDFSSMQPVSDSAGTESETGSGGSEEANGSDGRPENAESVNHSVGRTILRSFGFALLGFTLAGVLLFLRYRILREILRRRLADPDSGKQALNIYRQAVRVSGYGGEIPEDIRLPAERAAFSQHRIEDEELRKSRDALRLYTEDIFVSLGRMKKLLFQWWSGNL